MPTPDVRDDDEIEQLPPLDGDEGEKPAPGGQPDDIDEAGGEASLDDATGEDDPVDTEELDLDEREKGWVGEPAETPDLDMGEVGLLDFGGNAPATEDVEEPGVGDEDFGFGSAPERGGLDGGDEGPVAADEELREQDLPALDADEEGDLEDAALVDVGFAADEPLGLAWATEPWSRVGAPVALAAATAVACAGRGALVAGRTEGGAAELVRVDLEGTSQSLATEGLDAADVRALAVEGDLVAALVEGGGLRLSGDGGARFTVVAGGVAAAAVALVTGALWVRSRAGGLLVARPGETTFEKHAAAGSIAAMAADAAAGGAIAALALDDAGAPAALVRVMADGGAAREAIDGPEARSPALLAVRGEHVAYASRRGGVVRRAPDGAWMEHAWEGAVTALAFLDDAGALVAATYTDADDTTALVRLDAAGRAAVVARIGPAHSELEVDGRVVALACDDARGVVWVAGGFGVAAFAVG